MNEDVPICHCAEYYGSHAPDCPIAAEVRALRARVAKRERQLLCAYIGDLQFDDGEILYHHTFGHPPRRTLMDVHCTDAEILAEIDAALSARSGEDGR